MWCPRETAGRGYPLRRAPLPRPSRTAPQGQRFFSEGLSMFSWQLVDGEHGWFFRLRAANGNIICTSEIYSSKEAAEDTLKSLAGWFGECAVLWDVVQS